MRSAGFRCSTTSFDLVVVEGTLVEPKIVHQDSIKYPVDREGAALLKWARAEFIEILRRFEVRSVGIKRAELGRAPPKLLRVEVEGVLQEAAASSGISDVQCVRKQQLKSRLGFEGKPKYVSRLVQDRNLRAGRHGSTESDEALLAAWACLDG